MRRYTSDGMMEIYQITEKCDNKGNFALRVANPATGRVIDTAIDLDQLAIAAREAFASGDERFLPWDKLEESLQASWRASAFAALQSGLKMLKDVVYADIELEVEMQEPTEEQPAPKSVTPTIDGDTYLTRKVR